MVNQCAHQQVPLAVDQNEQVEHQQHGNTAPEGQSAANGYEDIGQEECKPDEVTRREQVVNEEAVYDTGFLQGQQHVGLDQHGGCLLHTETHEEINGQQEGHNGEQQREVATPRTPSEHGSNGHEIEGREAQTDIDKHLGHLVLFEQRMAAVGYLLVLAQRKEEFQEFFHLRSITSAWG